jgi:hypothetical protein
VQDRICGWYAEILNPNKLRKNSSTVSYCEIKKAGGTTESMSIVLYCIVLYLFRNERYGIALFLLRNEYWGDWRCSIGILYAQD